VIVEFTRYGKTYQCTLPAPLPPPATITIRFRPCILKPPMGLKRVWRATDELRGVELYRAIGGA
jgi:hypothetical protein